MGLELGQALSRLGSRVTIVEATERLLPDHEPEVAQALRELLEAEGVELVLGAQVERAATGPGGRARLALADGRALEGDALLVAAGRRASVEALRLSEAGVEGSAKGIPVDRRLETSARGHFAAGDVLGPPWGAFTHVARRQGREVVENAFALDPHDVDPDFGQRAIFTDPELAWIGITERAARERHPDVGVGKVELVGGKARAWGQERGLVKVVADRATRRILGARCWPTTAPT